MRIEQPILHPRSCWRSWSNPASRHVDPVGQTTAFLELDFWDFGVTSASAADAVLLLFIPLLPVCIFLNSFLFVQGSRLKVRRAILLASLCICRTMGDGRVTIADVTEVMDLGDVQKNACC